ncbi:hypothetical protein MesoLj113c_37070 [Mesorhizobium sp. 113-3-9]|nr:hypothetical protein MesoLj113c_37070 [Mesorhizobium sp. 113-3-9]
MRALSAAWLSDGCCWPDWLVVWAYAFGIGSSTINIASIEAATRIRPLGPLAMDIPVFTRIGLPKTL